MLMRHLPSSLHIYLWIVFSSPDLKQSMVNFNTFPRPSMYPIQPRNCPPTLLSMYSSLLLNSCRGFSVVRIQLIWRIYSFLIIFLWVQYIDCFFVWYSSVFFFWRNIPWHNTDSFALSAIFSFIVCFVFLYACIYNYSMYCLYI